MSDLKQTDLSRGLRELAKKAQEDDEIFKRLLISAADEIERYYTGMLNWKATAEAKDRAQPSLDAESYLRERYGAYRGHPEWRALVEAFNAGRRTQPEATAPAQDLSAAILGIRFNADYSDPKLQAAFDRGCDEALVAAAALASSANALSAGDRVDAEPFDIAPAEVRKVMRAPLAHGAWIERTGPLDLWALYNEHGFVRMLHRFEIEFVDGAIAAAILQSQKDGHA